MVQAIQARDVPLIPINDTLSSFVLGLAANDWRWRMAGLIPRLARRH